MLMLVYVMIAFYGALIVAAVAGMLLWQWAHARKGRRAV